jgi:hypothetical protein
VRPLLEPVQEGAEKKTEVLDEPLSSVGERGADGRRASPPPTSRDARGLRTADPALAESGVNHVKRNAIAAWRFESFAHFEVHLAEWQLAADQRVHGTTHERTSDPSPFAACQQRHAKTLPRFPPSEVAMG